MVSQPTQSENQQNKEKKKREDEEVKKPQWGKTGEIFSSKPPESGVSCVAGGILRQAQVSLTLYGTSSLYEKKIMAILQIQNDWMTPFQNI